MTLFVLMCRTPPLSTRTATLLPSTTRFRSGQAALRWELRQYFQALMPPEVETECAAGETGGRASREAVRKMGRDGWLGLGWPTEWGGQGRTDVEQLIFFNEAWRSGADRKSTRLNSSH